MTPVNQDVSDPMAAAGAALKGANGAANGGNGNRSPPAVMETVYAQPRQGRRRDEDIPLPAVNASAEEYYSSHMWSRARTFSNVRLLACRPTGSPADSIRPVPLAKPVVLSLSRWTVVLSPETGVCPTVSPHSEAAQGLLLNCCRRGLGVRP